jgi:hypothetical protein
MENGSPQDVTQAVSKSEIANDVALLYSWARIENTPYRDFSRRRTSPSQPLNPADDEAAGATSGSHPGISPSPGHNPVTVDLFDQATPGALNPQPSIHAVRPVIPEQEHETDRLPAQYWGRLKKMACTPDTVGRNLPGSLR